MSLSRKVLNVAAIIQYITGALTLALCLVIAGAGAIAMNNPEFAQEMPTALGPHTILIIAVLLGFGAITAFVYGFLEKRAVKDPSKIMPVWVLTLISLVGSAGSVIHGFAQHAAASDMKSSFTSLAIAILLFVVANNIKKEAGK